MINRDRNLRLLLVALLGGALLLGIDLAAQSAAPKPAESEITVSLRDGSIVRGTTSMETVEVQTIYGKLTVPMQDIVRLRFGQSAFQPAATQDEVEAKAFSVRGVVKMGVLELKTSNGTLRITQGNIATLADARPASAIPGGYPPAGGVFGLPPAALGGAAPSRYGAPFGAPYSGLVASSAAIHLLGPDPNGEPLAGERLLSTITYEGSFHVYGHEPVPQENGFDYYISPVRQDSELRGKRVRVSRVEVSVKGQSNGAVINWDLEVLAGASGDFGLPAGQFTKSHADPMNAYKITAPIHTRFTYQEVNYVRSIIIPAASRKDVTLDDGLRAQIFLWTADNRNCNLDIQTVSVRFFGETL